MIRLLWVLAVAVFFLGCVAVPVALSGLFGGVGVVDRQMHRTSVSEQVRVLEEKNKTLEERVERLQADFSRLYRAQQESRRGPPW